VRKFGHPGFAGKILPGQATGVSRRKTRISALGWRFETLQAGDVIVASSVSDDEAKKTYPEGWKAPRPYTRIVPQPHRAEVSAPEVEACLTRRLEYG